MKTALKIAIFYFIVVAIKLGEQHFGILSRFEISGAQVVVLLLLVYVALLVWEIAERIKLGHDVRDVRKASFILSFVIGGVFGIFGAYTGNPGDVSLGLIVTNFVGTGAVLGLIGALLSGAVFKVVTSRRDKSVLPDRTGGEHPCTGGEPPGGRTGRA